MAHLPESTAWVARLVERAFVPDGPGSRAEIPWRWMALPPLLAAALYGWHIGDGYLADDFVYAAWAQEGTAKLLHKLTLDSEPQTLRPLPGLVWAAMTGTAWSAYLLHALSVVLHALNGALVALLAGGGKPTREGAWLGALFVSFPLLPEPVIWISASFDLWSTFLALLCLTIVVRSKPSTRAGAASSLLFLAALLCKESVLLLPALLPLLGITPRARRPIAALGAVAALYLLVRLALFRDLGGYQGDGGASLGWRFEPLFFLRNLTLQLPYRLLGGMKQPEVWPAFAALSLLLGGAAALELRPWKPPARALRTLLVLPLALLPVAPIFSIDSDHESSRLLYFPLAMLTVALGQLGPSRRRYIGRSALVFYWSVLTLANGLAWHRAGIEVRNTSQAMITIASVTPRGSTVVVDAHDTYRGAYVWRNGLHSAAVQLGLDRDHRWLLGTVAQLPQPGPLLGRQLFEVGPSAGPGLANWTLCQQQLWSGALRPQHRWELADGAWAETPVQRYQRLDLDAVSLPPTGTPPAVELQFIRCDEAEAPAGRLLWRHRPGASFSITEAREFVAGPEGEPSTVIRLPLTRAPVSYLALRLELYRGGASCLKRVTLLEPPAACAQPPKLPAKTGEPME